MAASIPVTGAGGEARKASGSRVGVNGHEGQEGTSLATMGPRITMKLAEALMERKSIKTRMEEIKQRIYKNADPLTPPKAG